MFPAARRYPGLALALTLVLGCVCPAAADDSPLETLLAERRYEEALASLLVRTEEWALEVKRNDTPQNRTDWARSLLSLGMVEDRLGRHDSATAHLQQALDLLGDGDGTKSLRGDCHDALGLALTHAGQFAEAEPHLQEAMAIRGEAPEGEREPWFSASRDHLGLLYLQQGRYREAGPLLHESYRATDPGHHELLAQRLGYLARFYQTVNSNARARDMLQEAIGFAEKAWGQEHPNTLTLLGQLGLVHAALGQVDEARARLEEVTRRARSQATDATGRLRLAGFLNNLGSIELSSGDLETAQGCFREALQVLEAELGPDRLALAPLRNNLACTLQDLGAYAEARALLVQTREAYLAAMGPAHQRSAEALSNLALNTLLQSGPEAAREQIAETAAAAGAVLQRLLRFGSERQRLNYLREVDLLSLPCSAGEDAGLIANLLLASKGRLLDVLLAERPEGESPTLRRYRAARQELDLLLLSEADPDGEEAAALREELEALEVELDRTDQSAAPAPAPTWQEVQAGLPADGAFVDFVRFTDHLAGREVHYGAVVVLPTGPPGWVPLGREADLRTWLQVVEQRLGYRTAVLGGNAAQPPVLALKPALRQLHDQFWAPVAAQLPAGVRSLCLCPDGALNFLPFAVLLDGEDRFLASHHPLCAFVSSGRDLLLPARPADLAGGRWQVFAVPSFAAAGEPSDRAPFAEELVRAVFRMEPLAGAEREVRLLEPFFGPESVVHLGADATEESLRTIPPSPAVLHLVTHGFFLGDPANTTDDDRLQDFDANPLPFYRSGLVLHGAKRSLGDAAGGPGPTEDDILFANDVAGLPLHGTELVTLSSCQSALGDSLAGEGVLGLRRGFATAGARHLLLTLWPVSDATTPDFMRRFHELAAETGHLSQAAWQAQREGLSTVDPDNAGQLEFAVLTMGPFVLCQRQGLAPPRAFSPPTAPRNLLPLYAGIGIGLVLATAFFLLTRRKA